jgi:hypothetical protein
LEVSQLFLKSFLFRNESLLVTKPLKFTSAQLALLSKKPNSLAYLALMGFS